MALHAEYFLTYHKDFFSGSNQSKDQEEIERLITDWNITSHDPRILATNFSQTMLSLLNFDKEEKHKDRPAQIAILLALWDAIEGYPELARESFLGSKLSPDRSKLELRMRLAARMFFYGRRVLFNYSNVSDAAANFERSIQLFSVDDSDLKSLNDFQASKLLGMRGTTKLFLGRLNPPSLDRWLDSYSDMWKSFELGNKGKEAARSLRELALKILNLELTDEGFERFEKVSNLAHDEDHQFHSDAAIFHQYRAAFFVENSQPELAIEQCRKGLDSCEAALLLSPPPADEAFSRSTRAFLRQVIIQQSVDFPEDAEIEELKDIIDDLRISYEFKLGGAALPLALLRRSFLLKKAEKDEAAMADLSECLERLDLIVGNEQREATSRNARASIVDIKLRQAAACNDPAELIRFSRELIKLGESAWFYFFTISTSLSGYLKATDSLDDSTRSAAQSMIREFTAEFLRAQRSSEDELLSKSLSLAASYAANSSRMLDDAGVSVGTVRLYEIALSQGSGNNVEFEAFSGNVSLQYGKQLAKEGLDHPASAHYKDAVRRLESATARIEAGEEFDDEALRPVVTYSKLGEACLRLAKSGNRDLALYEQALRNFEKARELGNDTAELSGLIGDVYYRQGFWGNDADALKRALKMKTTAAASGGNSRENSSVTARICEALFSSTGDHKEIRKAVECTLDAIAIDENWPWPYFQLAEFVSRYKEAHDSLSEVPTENLPTEIRNLRKNAFEQMAQSLRIKGVEKVLDNSEFKKRVLGGRSKVFVLEDPHRLISSSIVLKPTRKTDAEREISLTNRMRQVLLDLGETSRFGVPAPIGILEVSDTDCIYAMRRELGSTLADELLGSTSTGYPQDLEALRATARFLGLFHKAIPTTKSTTVASNRIAKEVSGRLKRSSRKAVLSTTSMNLIVQRLPREIPAVSKKDGHAENWIIGPRGKIIVIDLEATQSSAVLLDLTQLIEDFPSIPVTNEGWIQRMNLVASYWDTLGIEGTQPDYLRELYEIHAIQRAVWGHGFCHGKFDTLESSTSRRALSSRLLHFENLLKFLARGGGSGTFSSVAYECLHKLRI